ncbi:hypothetical protein ACLOJK_038372 [Asimina triloba]
MADRRPASPPKTQIGEQGNDQLQCPTSRLPSAPSSSSQRHTTSDNILVSIRLATPSSNDEQRTEPTDLNRSKQRMQQCIQSAPLIRAEIPAITKQINVQWPISVSEFNSAQHS